MVKIHHSPKGTPYVRASELHNKLKVIAPIDKWFQEMIDYGFVENVDYSCNHKQFTHEGRDYITFDWFLQLDMAKHIAMVQRTELGKSLREYLTFLDKRVQDGKLLSHEQVKVLFEICKILGYFTVQKHFERKHYDFFNKPKEWWKYRAKLLGYDKSDLEQMVKAIGLRYESERQALFHVDRQELIRVAIIDLFMGMGKSEEYAKNVARFVESIAEEINPPIYDDTKMSLNFKSNSEIATIEQLKSHSSESNSLLKIF